MAFELIKAVHGETYPATPKQERPEAERAELNMALKLIALGTAGSYSGGVNALFEAVIGLYSDVVGKGGNLNVVADGVEKTAANFVRYLRDRQSLVEMPVKGLKPN